MHRFIKVAIEMALWVRANRDEKPQIATGWRVYQKAQNGKIHTRLQNPFLLEVVNDDRMNPEAKLTSVVWV